MPDENNTGFDANAFDVATTLITRWQELEAGLATGTLVSASSESVVIDPCPPYSNVKTELERCATCGAVMPNGYSVWVARDIEGGICESCALEFKSCDKCGVMFREAEIIVINRPNGSVRFYCEDCADDRTTYCEDCGDRILRVDACYWSDEAYCPSCYEDITCECESCGREYHPDDLYDGICSRCQREEEDNEIIHDDHTYCPGIRFYKRDAEVTDYFTGLEIEIENRGDMGTTALAEKILEIDDRFMWIKRDGSLSNGFEIVTQPFSWGWLKTEGVDILRRVCDIRNFGARSYNTTTCGLHVHINRDAFSTLQIYKILQFFYSNREYIHVVSQRHWERLEQWAGWRSGIESKEHFITAAKEKRGMNYNRYVCFNMTPGDTYEVRIFKGTLHLASMLKDLEFCKALYEFTLCEETKKMWAGEFDEFVSRNRKEYLNLFNFLVVKGRIQTTDRMNKAAYQGLRGATTCV